MILWLALLVSHCSLNGAAAENKQLERIESCHTRCSQGLNCKNKPEYWFPPACQNPAEGLNTSNVFGDIGISTVMKCEKKQKCTLHLRVQMVLQLSESIHGISICTNSAGMMMTCHSVVFTKASRKKMSGLPVTIENDCIEVSPNQPLQVIVKTVPNYCEISWSSTYQTPECTNEDLRMNVPECITGRLSYSENPERKELKITVTDMLEDQNYHLRLCHKDFICLGTGAKTLMNSFADSLQLYADFESKEKKSFFGVEQSPKIKKEQPLKSVVLQYSRPLPCLCIEGWSAVMDAPRVQVCPFKDRLEELWYGITFDPLEEALIWEPACPISAVAGLCEIQEDGNCTDLPHSSQNVSRERVAFAKVDPHPQLCMKFSVGSQSWIRCPFADTIKAWDVVMTRRQRQEKLQLLSKITATFSVGLCEKSAGSSGCQTTKTHTIHVEKQKAVDLKLTGVECSSCLQVKRLDVKFAPTVVHCVEQCMSKSSDPAALDLTWVILPVAICLSGIIIFSLVLHILLTVYQRRKQGRRGVCVSTKHTDADRAYLNSVVSTLQTQPILTGRVLVPDSPQCGNNEKVNLISNGLLNGISGPNH